MVEIRRARRAIPWLLVVLCKLWLVDGQRLTAYGTLTIDDQWFVERASFIAAGEWLGPFAFDTLIKQPGYPIFIAFVDRFGFPLLLAHQLLYVAAVAAVIRSLRPLAWSRWRSLLAFAVLIFSPMTMNAPLSARPDRTAIYPSLTLLFFAGLIGLVTAPNRPHPTRSGLLWAIITSLSLGALWLTREEWLLVLPALVVGLAVALVRLGRDRHQSTIRRLACAAAVLCVPLIIPLGTGWLERTNESHYGLAVTNVEQTSMSAAIGAMTRVEPTTTFPQHPVTVETRETIYAVSPTMRGIRDHLETGVGQLYALRRRDGVRDLPGQVFMWAVLDAINGAGHAQTAVQLDAEFHAIADEIDTACEDGRLRCSKPHHGIAPSWEWGRVPGLTGRSITSLRRMFELTSFTAQPPGGNGTAQDLALFTRMTNEKLAPGPNTFFVRLRVTLIGLTRLLYRLLLIATAVICVRRLRAAIRERRRPVGTMPTIIVLGVLLVVTRAVGLAYLDLTTFPGFSPTYLAPGYAAGLVTALVATLQRSHVDTTLGD